MSLAVQKTFFCLLIGSPQSEKLMCITLCLSARKKGSESASSHCYHMMTTNSTTPLRGETFRVRDTKWETPCFLVLNITLHGVCGHCIDCKVRLGDITANQK